MLGISRDQRDADPQVLPKAMRRQDGMTGFRCFHGHGPRVFGLVVDDPPVAKVILTRNPLESYISWKIARESNQWQTTTAANIKTARPKFEIGDFRARVDELQAFQLLLQHRMQASGQAAFFIDYHDVLDLNVINGLAVFLWVEGWLKKLDLSFKKQNPEPTREKVSNPAKIRMKLAKTDFFNIDHAPNFEPRRQRVINTYVASDSIGSLFPPIKSEPDLRKWLAG